MRGFGVFDPGTPPEPKFLPPDSGPTLFILFDEYNLSLRLHFLSAEVHVCVRDHTLYSSLYAFDCAALHGEVRLQKSDCASFMLYRGGPSLEDKAAMGGVGYQVSFSKNITPILTAMRSTTARRCPAKSLSNGMQQRP